MAPILKETWEIDLMRRAGRVVAQGLKLLEGMVRPGLSTADLDAAFDRHVRQAGAVPTFKGYRGFPASICASINDEVVHGIPSSKRVLQEGDIVSIDAGATYKGYVGDAAITVGVGKIPERARKLIEVTRGALEAAIQTIGPGVRLFRVSAAIQEYAETRGYSVVRDFVGHGIGQRMHEDPQVPNYVLHPVESFDLLLKTGMCLAIEPMVNEGNHEVHTLDDRWTVVTDDRKLSAHFEHTVAVTKGGREVLTLL